MVKCVAVDCKAGYDSTRKSSTTGEKELFYYVPKNGKIIKLWRKAILRDDIKLKPCDAVCKKHFKEDDFIYEKLIFGQDGNIIGKTILKKPQLKEGALPSLHLGKKITSQKSRKLPAKRCSSIKENTDVLEYKRRKNDEATKCLTLDDNMKLATRTKSILCSQDEINVSFLEKEAGHSDINSNLTKNDENEKNNSIIEAHVEPSDNKTILFQNLAQQEVQMPPSWIRSNISWGNEHGISFVKLIGLKCENGLLDSTFHKKIIINEQLLMNISINGRNMNRKDFGINYEKIKSLENMAEILEILDKCQICFGNTSLNMDESNSSLLRTFCYLDGIGTLRNNNCPILLPMQLESNNRQCRCCSNIKQVLNKKIIRHQHNKRNYIPLKKISPTKRQKKN